MKHRAFSLLETVVASAMLAVLLTVSLKMVGTVAAGRNANRLRQTAVEETANAMERLGTLTWDELSTDRVEAIRLDAATASVLPEPDVHIGIVEAADATLAAVPAVRVIVSIRWRNTAGAMAPPVRLVAWRHGPPNTPKEDGI